jgi:hypothetical protein
MYLLLTDATKTVPWRLVTAAGNELSEVDVTAFKVEAKQLQFGDLGFGLQKVRDVGKMCGRIR